MLRVIELWNINMGDPFQWEGRDDKDNPVYVRFADGYLSVSIGVAGDSIFTAVYGEEVFGKHVSLEQLDHMSFEQVRALTYGFVDWPKQAS